GDVGEVGKVAEGADDPVGLDRGQAIEQAVHFRARIRILAPAELYGVAPYRLNEVEDPLSSLFTNHVAENSPRKADIFAQRIVLARVGQRCGVTHRRQPSK